MSQQFRIKSTRPSGLMVEVTENGKHRVAHVHGMGTVISDTVTKDMVLQKDFGFLLYNEIPAPGTYKPIVGVKSIMASTKHTAVQDLVSGSQTTDSSTANTLASQAKPSDKEDKLKALSRGKLIDLINEQCWPIDTSMSKADLVTAIIEASADRGTPAQVA